MSCIVCELEINKIEDDEGFLHSVQQNEIIGFQQCSQSNRAGCIHYVFLPGKCHANGLF